jgi:hypothetical protein
MDLWAIAGLFFAWLALQVLDLLLDLGWWE